MLITGLDGILFVFFTVVVNVLCLSVGFEASMLWTIPIALVILAIVAWIECDYEFRGRDTSFKHKIAIALLVIAMAFVSKHAFDEREVLSPDFKQCGAHSLANMVECRRKFEALKKHKQNKRLVDEIEKELKSGWRIEEGARRGQTHIELVSGARPHAILNALMYEPRFQSILKKRFPRDVFEFKHKGARLLLYFSDK